MDTNKGTTVNVTASPAPPSQGGYVCTTWRCWFQEQSDKFMMLFVFAGILAFIIYMNLLGSKELVNWAENLAYGAFGALTTLANARRSTNPASTMPPAATAQGGDAPAPPSPTSVNVSSGGASTVLVSPTDNKEEAGV